MPGGPGHFFADFYFLREFLFFLMPEIGKLLPRKAAISRKLGHGQVTLMHCLKDAQIEKETRSNYEEQAVYARQDVSLQNIHKFCH